MISHNFLTNLKIYKKEKIDFFSVRFSYTMKKENIVIVYG